MGKRNTKLYNVIFPIWLLIIVPPMWALILPINYAVDFAVLFYTFRHLNIENPKDKAKKVIIKVWLCGFVADFMGAMLMMVSNSAAGNTRFHKMVGRAMYNPFKNIYAFGWVAMCVVVTAVLIYLLNYNYCLYNLKLEKIYIRKIALSMAVFTAPYLFFIPAYF